MSVAPFEIESGYVGEGIRQLSVKGELDLDTAPTLAASIEAIEAGQDEGLILDLTDCGFIDSTGIALLVKAWKRLDIDGGDGGTGRVVLCGPSPQVQRVFDITGLDRSISVHSNPDEALKALRDLLGSASH